MVNIVLLSYTTYTVIVTLLTYVRKDNCHNSVLRMEDNARAHTRAYMHTSHPRCARVQRGLRHRLRRWTSPKERSLTRPFTC